MLSPSVEEEPEGENKHLRLSMTVFPKIKDKDLESRKQLYIYANR